MQFKDIIGQQALKKHLIQTVKEKRISHAQLFAGTEGSGNLALAVAYAQYICCENRGETDSCGECKSCRQFQKLIHPDLHFAFPVNTTAKIKKDPTCDDFIADWREMIIDSPYFTEQNWYEKIGIDNKQGNISKDDANAIIKKMNFKPYESDYKFMIIWLPERMNTTAANKLLKLIEEPPPNTVFLLAAKDVNQILGTILSRTQLIKIPPIDEISMKQMLAQKYTLTEHEIGVLAHLAAGDVVNARNIVEQREQERDFFDCFSNLMQNAISFQFFAMANWAEDMAKMGREQQKTFLFYALKMIRESFMINRNMENIVYVVDDEHRFVENISKYITTANIVGFYNSINLAVAHISQNGNAKIIFTDLAIIVARLIRKK